MIISDEGITNILYFLRPEYFCQSNTNSHVCDPDKKLMGPFKYNQGSDGRPEWIAFFSDATPLDIEEYSYHKSRLSTDTKINHSYLYLLADIKNANLGSL